MALVRTEPPLEDSLSLRREPGSLRTGPPPRHRNGFTSCVSSAARCPASLPGHPKRHRGPETEQHGTPNACGRGPAGMRRRRPPPRCHPRRPRPHRSLGRQPCGMPPRTQGLCEAQISVIFLEDSRSFRSAVKRETCGTKAEVEPEVLRNLRDLHLARTPRRSARLGLIF